MLHSVPLKLLSLHGLVTVLALFVYVLTSHALQQRRHPSAAIGWVLFILLLPYAALPLYLLFGTRKMTHAHHIEAHAAPRPPEPEPGGSWLAGMTAALKQSGPAAYRDLRVHGDGSAAFAALLEVIDGACESLDLCTFILRGDAVGKPVCEHLAARARAGVRVRVLVDGVGQLMGGGGADIAALEASGVLVERFPPSARAPMRGRANLRNHRKLLVADAGLAGERLWSGGRNLAAEYFMGEGGQPPWHDLSFDLRGPLARQGAALFERSWLFSAARRRAATVSEETKTAARQAHLGAASPDGCGPVESAPDAVPAISPLQDPPPSTAQLVSSGPDEDDDTVHALLVSAAYRASRRIVLVSPYVVLEEALLMALCLAARRGVQVDLLMPARSNHRLADAARHRSLRALADAGARIWLAPCMHHAKLAVFDDALALAGSANLDGRSLFLNYEVMCAFDAPADVARFREWFDAELAGAARYGNQPPGLARDIAEGLLLWVGFQV